uniref:Uncharacterized protein n=1 Tax=Ditylenchus dipsaci TaxID=166011 RepID=A0A915DRT3_9BILA
MSPLSTEREGTASQNTAGEIVTFCAPQAILGSPVPKCKITSHTFLLIILSQIQLPHTELSLRERESQRKIIIEFILSNCAHLIVFYYSFLQLLARD